MNDPLSFRPEPSPHGRASQRAAGFGLLCTVTAAAPAAPAAAAPSEAPVQVVYNAAQPDRWVVRYDGVGGGLLFSDDAGETWKLMCNDAIDTALTRGNTAAAVSSAGDVFSGSLDGLWRVSEGGCQSAAEPVFADLWVTDLTVDPRDPQRLYAVTASSNADNGLLRFDAGKDAWEFVGAREPIAIGSVQAVAEGDGLRLYQSVLGSETTVDEEGTEQFQRFVEVRHSDDEGQTWKSFRAFEGTRARTVTVAAVDPTDPQRIVLAESYGRDNTGRNLLWLNEAAGDADAYQLLADLEWFGGATFGPEGQLWFSDAEGALFTLAKGESEPVTLASNARARCLSYNAPHQTLLACQPFGVSVVEADGSLRTVLDFRSVSDWVSCDGDLDVAAQCEARLGMQDGWCSATHYPQADVCAAYCYPGVASSSVEASQLPDHCSDEAETDAGAEGPRVSDAGTDAAPTDAAPTDAAPAAPSAPSDPSDASEGGVDTAGSESGGCQAISRGPLGGAGLAFFLTMLGLRLRLTAQRTLRENPRRHGARGRRARLFFRTFGDDKARCESETPSSAVPLVWKGES